MASFLHTIAQALLIPVIALLIAFIGYALFCIGSIIVEAVNERRNFKVEMPRFLAALMAAGDADIPNVIKSSGLLNRQKVALLTAYDYRTLPGDALVALIRRLVGAEETHYTRIADRNNTAAKIAPMAGLMGTLIPLGPGVAALGTGDTATLSNSLLIAFDTTVAGLIVAVICLAIGKIRSNWYNDYMQALDSGMATLLEKIENMRSAGQITVKEPSSYAFMFQQGLKKDKTSEKEGRQIQVPAGQPQAQSGVTGAAPAASVAQQVAARPAAQPGQVQLAAATQAPAARPAAQAAATQATAARPAAQAAATARPATQAAGATTAPVSSQQTTQSYAARPAAVGQAYPTQQAPGAQPAAQQASAAARGAAVQAQPGVQPSQPAQQAQSAAAAVAGAARSAQGTVQQAATQAPYQVQRAAQQLKDQAAQQVAPATQAAQQTAAQAAQRLQQAATQAHPGMPPIQGEGGRRG